MGEIGPDWAAGFVQVEAFDTLFSKQDYAAAERFWSPHYIRHSVPMASGRGGLFALIKSIPRTLKYEAGTIAAEGNFVIVHGGFSGSGAPVNSIAVDILRIEEGILVKHWDVIQDEATQEQSIKWRFHVRKDFPKAQMRGSGRREMEPW
jgi:predicted SnoaL-like aldol condensation-catalyzing enzyme